MTLARALMMPLMTSKFSLRYGVPWLLVLLMPLAVWIDFGNFHRFHASDSLIQVFVSTQQWTFFFWDQNRYGMFTALLAAWIGNPFWNLLFQYWIVIFAVLGSFFMLARLVLRGGLWFWAGGLSLCLFLLLTNDLTAFIFFYQPYAAPMFWGCLGLWCIEAGMRTGGFCRAFLWLSGFVLMFVSAWVCMPMPLLLGVVLGIRALMDQEPGSVRRGLWQGALLAVSFILIWSISKTWPYRWEYGLSAPSEWIDGMMQLSSQLWRYYFSFGKGPILIIALLSAWILARRFLGPPQFRELFLKTAGAAGPLFVAGMAALFLFGANSWVRANDFRPNYAATAYLFFQSAAVVAIALPASRLIRISSRRSVCVISLLLVVSVALVYGKPSVTGVRRDLESTVGVGAEELRRSGATHIMGDFLKAWPVAFWVNVLNYEQGKHEPLWVISAHSTTTRARWAAGKKSDVRIAVFRGDPAAKGYIEGYKIPPLTPAGGTERFDLFAISASDAK